MLPLLRHRLILAVLVGSSFASAEGDSSWIDVGVGYDVEAFHWHESAKPVWWTWVRSGDYLYKRSVALEGDRRFLTETGFRGIPHAELRLRLVPGMRLSGRFGYVMGTVDYDGGLQPGDSTSQANWPLDTIVQNGTMYYHFAHVGMTSYTGWFGPSVSLGLQLRSAPPRTGGYFTAADVSWDWRSLTRKLVYTTTRIGGYDEIWSLSQLRASAGPGWKNAAGSFRAYLGAGLPLSSDQKIQKASATDVAEVTLEPKPRMGWFAGAVWESPFGLELGVRWEKQTWDESQAVYDASGDGASQPRSIESTLRLETAWIF